MSGGRYFTTTGANSYKNAMTAFLNTINASSAGGATWKLCAVSYYHTVGGVQAYKSPPEVYVITGVKMHTRVDSMRRRTGKEVT